MSPLINCCSRYILVVVDMQPGYTASLDAETMMGVLDEIRAAMAARMPIIVLQASAETQKETHGVIMDLLNSYDSELWVVQDKVYHPGRCFSGSDGSIEVLEALEVLELPQDHFRICGVNTEICVFLTAMVLSQELPNARIDIVKRACNSQYRSKAEQWESWACYERLYGWYKARLVD